MKKYNFLLLIFLLGIISCSKKKANSNGLSQDIQNFVPQSVIDSMRTWGLIINEGQNPPDIAGIYNFSRNLCTYDNSGGNRADTYFDNYHFKFYNQNNSKLTIALDYKDLNGTDTASGVGSFIAGTGNKFTVFVDVNGNESGVPYQAISFYSGVKTDQGIQNFQIGFYLKSKGSDPSGILVKVGTSRIFKDADAFSEELTDY